MPRYTDLALGAGAVLAVGLGLIALKPDSLPTSGEEAGSVITDTPSSLATKAAPTSSASASASASSRGSAKPDASSGSAWVVGAGYGLAVRSEQRGCDADGPASITVIGSAGGTITREVDGLRAVGGIDVESAQQAQLVGVDTDCKRVGYATDDAGRTWTKLGEVPTIWSLVPDDTTEVHAPSGQVDVPCAPRSITGLDDKVARLACTDGRLLGTVNAGDDWSILGNNGDVEAVGFVSATTALALTGSDACDGVEVQRSTDGGTDFASAYCVEGHGPWGVYTDSDTAVVVGGDVVARSADGGEKWDVTRIRS
ncbi:hypothetical protein [Nocardioides jiangxiensis]|uniref:Exo-alpha-sialidase n=1 Tax=Nocardioides jiangxiensis TaxID=3064524 RepID=A0ABT9B0V9_9ACTN|nr:hypothetical protein [Nocardioides sp. WY-20]MDO7866778.1 hypothetical protein [Nocardioides sp. WY-20]